MRFVEFTDKDGKEVWVDADKITTITEKNGVTLITTGFFTEFVQEKPREVLEKINTQDAEKTASEAIDSYKIQKSLAEQCQKLIDMTNEQYPAPEKKTEPKSDFNLLFGTYKKVEENFKRLGLLKRAFERGYRKGKNETLAKCLTAVYNKLYETKQLSHNLIEDIHQTMLDAARR